jgi:hypothetical protein
MKDTNMKLSYTVDYTIQLADNDVIIVQELCKASKFSNACAFLMTTYKISLHDANCIRKALTQGRREFDCDLTIKSNNI